MKSRFFLIISLIILLAAILRLWQLGVTPAGPNWDEAAIGYNGWSIWHTRRDEWLERLPISFRSFGDYKAPLAIYINGLFTSIMGLDVWVIRLPFALAGVMAVVGFGVLVSLIMKQVPKNAFHLKPQLMILLGTAMMAVSPWHILFSRVGFESGLALTEVLWATNFLLISKKYSQNLWRQLNLQLAAILLFASTFYTYHSAKVMMPLFLVMLYFFVRSQKILTIKRYLVLLLGTMLLLIPFLLDSILGEGLARASVTIFAQSKSLSEILRLLVTNTWAHLQPSFLLFGKADSVRHSIGTMGVLYPTTLLFVFIGLLQGIQLWFAKQRQHVPNASWSIWFFAVGWIVAGLVPAIIGMEVPHPNRALLSLPGFLLLAILGIDTISTYLQKRRHITVATAHTVALVIICVEVLQPITFLKQYFGSYNLKVSHDFQDGYTEMYDEVWSYYDGKANRSKIDQFVITSEYGQPYIFALMSRKISTYQYHNGALINFLFPDVVQLSDLDRPNALVVAGEKSDLIDRTKATKIIYSRDGKPRFWLFDTNIL